MSVIHHLRLRVSNAYLVVGDRLILVDTGTADQFLETQLKPDIFISACEKEGQRLDYRMREGYGHDYYFIATSMDEHIAHHAKALVS